MTGNGFIDLDMRVEVLKQKDNGLYVKQESVKLTEVNSKCPYYATLREGDYEIEVSAICPSGQRLRQKFGIMVVNDNEQSDEITVSVYPHKFGTRIAKCEIVLFNCLTVECKVHKKDGFIKLEYSNNFVSDSFAERVSSKVISMINELGL